MTAIPILLADAVTTVINTAVAADTFAVEFEARRSYPDWDLSYADLEERKTLVDVVFVSGQGGNGDLVELDSAASLNYEPALDICVRHKFGQDDRTNKEGRLLNDSVDPLVKLIEQLHELLAEDRLTSLEITTGIYANWVDTSIRAHVNQRRLREGCFEGVVRVRFDVSKAVA